jgi:putative peptidoglycan lipid II flippase
MSAVRLTSAGHAANPGQQTHHRRLVRATGVWGFWTLVSRVSGFAREILLARAFGTSAAATTIVVAQTVPNLSRTLVSEEVARGAVLPLVTDELAEGNESEAWRLTTATAAWSTIVMAVVSAIAWFTATWSVRVIAPGVAGKSGDFRTQTTEVLRILLPLILSSGLTASSSAFLVAKRRFGVAGMAMVGANVPLVVTLLFVRHPSVRLAAALITAGAAVQAAIQVVAALRARQAGRFSWHARHLSTAGRLAVPVVLTLGAASFSGLIDIAFASTVSTGGPAALDKAFRLMLVPYGVFAVAVGVVAMPSLVEAARNRDHQFDRELIRATRLQASMLVPAALLIGFAATPIVSLIYQRGAFDAASTRLTTSALIGIAFVLPARGFSLIGSRAWLSQKRPWFPACCSLAGLVVNGLLDWALVGPLGLLGIGISTAIVHGTLGVGFIVGAASEPRFVLRELASFAARLAASNAAGVAAAIGVAALAGLAIGGRLAGGLGIVVAIGVLLAASVVVRLDDYATIGASFMPLTGRTSEE